MANTDVKSARHLNDELIAEKSLSDIFDKCLELHRVLEDSDSTSEKYKCSLSNTSISSEDIISKQEKDIGLFPVREQGLLIAVLSHPMTVKLSGPAFFQVISGSVKILGYVMEQFHGVVPLYSANKIMCLDIKTERTENICTQASRLQVVKDLFLKNEVPESMADRILNSCDNSSVIVGFSENFKSSDMHFARSLMPSVFDLEAKKIGVKSADVKYFGFEVYIDRSGNLDYPQCENFISDVLTSIKDSDEKCTSAPRIVVQGKKGMGKSTFLRYVINRVLNKFDVVYYLDADPGQSEFTPGGCVSLVKVTAPLLGPPFTHLKTPIKMYYLGTCNVQTVPKNYSKCVKLLCEYYKEKCCTIPLFVNTIGWLEGTGLKLLEELKSVVQPTDIVKIEDQELRGTHEGFQIDVEPVGYTAKEYIYEKFAPTDEIKMSLKPAVRRSLSIMSYLGNCVKTYNKKFTLNGITPYCIHWSDVAIYFTRDRHDAKNVLNILVGSFVALLSIDGPMVVECDDVLPKILKTEPVGKDCYGFGLIRAIDNVRKNFYVITPVREDRLKKVNAIMIGDIHFPETIYTSQEVEGKLPFIVQD